METPPSPLALFVRLARDPAGSRAPAFAWHSFERDPVTWSYARTYRAAAAAAAKVSNVVRARGAPPPKVSPLQTSPEHRAHCVGVFVSEGPGLLLLTLAVGLCGCAFVPLSKHDPPRRLAAAMRDAAVSLAVVDDDFAARRAKDALGIVSRDGDGETETESDALETRVLRLSELFDVGAFEDAASSESGDERRSTRETNAETETDALVSELADLDLDACLERHPDRVSHVFFTSGSTGTPKGCVATRGALAWFAEGKKKTHDVDASSVVLVASPHVFDPSLGDFYASLAAGGCVALCPESRLKSDLGACLAATKATHLTATPTALGSVVLNENDAFCSDDARRENRGKNFADAKRSAFPSLRVVALGGEPTPRSLAEAWAGVVPVLANTYGVTECCVYQTFSKMDANDPESRRRLGGGFPGVRMIHAAPPGDDPANVAVDETSGSFRNDALAFRLPTNDDKQEKRENDSSLAELWLAGPQVGLGYAGDPKRTEARFRVVSNADGFEERLFRTGDITKLVSGLGRVLVGRGDGQVKIRGRRVELGEIESAMRECLTDVLSDVAVTATGKKNAENDGGSDGALVAWAVARDEETKTKSDVSDVCEKDASSSSVSYSTPTATTCDAMRWVLTSLVPEYMLPARFAFLRASRLPVTASGKTARRALARLPPPPPPDRGLYKKKFPRRERALASIVKRAWSEELGVPPHAVERASRFAELGGDSMVAARVCRAVHAAFLTRAKNTNGAEDVGAHGEFLTGALAPASLAGDVSLGAFVSRVAADLGTGLETNADGNDDEDEDEEDEEEEEDDVSSDRLGSDDESAAAGVSLLYRAAREDAAGIVRALLRRSVPVDGWRDARGVTNDAREGASSVARNKNKNQNKNKKEALFASSPLHAACAAGAEATVLVLLERGALPRARARRGATPLHLAAAAAKPFSVDGLRRLLAFADGAEKTASELKTTPTRRDGRDKGASALASLDDDRQSVLHYAARSGASASIAEWLIDTAETLRGQKRMGATENAFAEWRDVWGRTAMHWAALNGHRAVVAALLHRGASRHVADARGETPVQLAERRALCSARDRPDGERASRWGDVATLLGGAGTTKHLKKSLAP